MKAVFTYITFYTPWKHQKQRGFLMFSDGIEREQWLEMDLVPKLCNVCYLALSKSWTPTLAPFKLQWYRAWDAYLIVHFFIMTDSTSEKPFLIGIDLWKGFDNIGIVILSEFPKFLDFLSVFPIFLQNVVNSLPVKVFTSPLLKIDF